MSTVVERSSTLSDCNSFLDFPYSLSSGNEVEFSAWIEDIRPLPPNDVLFMAKEYVEIFINSKNRKEILKNDVAVILL